jgi:[ribosomal protein S5]-alanine N-acetyltransferase
MATGLELETTRLRLRPFRAADVGLVHALWTDADVRRFLFDDRRLSPEDTRSRIEASLANFEQHGYGLWLAFARDGGALVGFAGLLRAEEAPPNLIYGIAPDFWGRGYATEAARAVLDYALTLPGLAKVAADVDEPNTASVRVLEKLGMRRTHGGAEEGSRLIYFEKSAADGAD